MYSLVLNGWEMFAILMQSRSDHGAGVDSSQSLRFLMEPVSNESSDLCEISDLFLFVSCLASQSKKI